MSLNHKICLLSTSTIFFLRKSCRLYCIVCDARGLLLNRMDMMCGETEFMYVLCGVKCGGENFIGRTRYEYVSQIILKNNGSCNT